MNRLYFRTLWKAVDHYTGQGYIFPFDFSKRTFQAANWTIIETYRFEGFSDPSDNTVLYVLEGKNGLDKGLVIDAYGAGRDERINQLLQNVPRQFPDWLITHESQLPYLA